MSLSAEQATLAGCIRSAEVYETVSQRVSAEDFADPRCRLLYQTVSALRITGHPVDAVTVEAAIGSSAAWRKVNGAGECLDYVLALDEATSSLISAEGYVEILVSAALTRKLGTFTEAVRAVGADTGISADEKISRVQALIAPLEVTDPRGFTALGDAGDAALAALLSRGEGGGAVGTGLADLDAMIGGFRPGELVVLGGRPSMGKTAWMMNFALHVAQSHAVQVFSLEMTRAELALRSMATLAPVDFTELRAGRIDQHMEQRLREASGEMRSLNMAIDDRGMVRVDQLLSRARVAARRQKPALIVVDYLTLLVGKGENRTAEVGYCSRMLKGLAKELDCTVLCLAQLNRSLEARADKRPMKSDLRDSGEIEQDADVILFTYLHEKYNPDTPRRGCAELIVDKQRNGATGTVFARWEGHHQRFSTWSGPVPPEDDEDDTGANGSRGKASFAGKKWSHADAVSAF